jgi:hypothetical protein
VDDGYYKRALLSRKIRMKCMKKRVLKQQIIEEARSMSITTAYALKRILGSEY